MPDSPQIPSDADRTEAASTAATGANETAPVEQAPADQATPAVEQAADPGTHAATQPLPDAAPPASAIPASATQPYPAAPVVAPAVAPAPRTKRPVGLLVGALAVGAIIGGAAGGGVVAATLSANDRTSGTSTSTPQSITVNNKDDVSTTTAVAAKAGPSVVTISVTASSESGTGSGVVLSSDGYVLTNTHVVTLDGASAAGTIEVTAANGKLYQAKVVGTDPVVDLAVIKLTDATGLQPIEFGDSGNLNVGQKAIAIGAPLGLSNTVTDGIISSLNRSIQIASSAVPGTGSGDSNTPNDGSTPFNFWNFGDGSGGSNGNGSGGSTTTPTTQTADISLPVIQTDAPINPGNSGGALLDSSGKLIGINVAIASTGSTSANSQSGSIGVGFAVPADLAKRISSEIIKNGKGSHGLLGASVTTATSSSSSVVGALIASVSSGGGADKAGLKKGDVVTTFNGVPITDSTDLTAQVRSLAPGSTAKLTYVRGSDSSTVSVTLGTLQL
jgi:putative serine protease PepD